MMNYCNHLPYLKVIKSCGNALEAKLELQTQKIDIIFLDINMPVLDGIAFLKILLRPPLVIFTTAYKEYALDAFDLFACDYLLKPFSLERFIIAVDRALERMPGVNAPASGSVSGPGKELGFFFVRSGGKIIRIGYADFLFAEAQGNYIKVVCFANTILVNTTFAGFEGLLPKEIFSRVHRSFIINRSKISHIEGNALFIDKIEIPIGTHYRDGLMKSLNL